MEENIYIKFVQKECDSIFSTHNHKELTKRHDIKADVAQDLRTPPAFPLLEHNPPRRLNGVQRENPLLSALHRAMRWFVVEPQYDVDSGKSRDDELHPEDERVAAVTEKQRPEGVADGGGGEHRDASVGQTRRPRASAGRVAYVCVRGHEGAHHAACQAVRDVGEQDEVGLEGPEVCVSHKTQSLQGRPHHRQEQRQAAAASVAPHSQENEHEDGRSHLYPLAVHIVIVGDLLNDVLLCIVVPGVKVGAHVVTVLQLDGTSLVHDHIGLEHALHRVGQGMQK